MVPQELSSDVVKIIEQLDKLLPSFPLDFTLQNTCLAKRRSEHFPFTTPESLTITQPHERRVSIHAKRLRSRTDADESEAKAGR